MKKEGWGGGGTRQVKFTESQTGEKEILKPSGKILNVSVSTGLPSTTSECIPTILDALLSYNSF